VVQQPGERPQQEVAAATCRVDQPDFVQPERLDGRLQSAVKDELLDEDGRLQQGVLLAGRLGQVLVQVTQEAGVERRVGEVVDETAALSVDPLEEWQEQVLGRVGR
jgi:hypothetical protein